MPEVALRIPIILSSSSLKINLSFSSPLLLLLILSKSEIFLKIFFEDFFKSTVKCYYFIVLSFYKNKVEKFISL